MKEKLKILAGSPELRRELAAENLATITQWTREAESPRWNEFFSRMLHKSDPQQQFAKRVCMELPYNHGLGKTVELFLKDSWSWKITFPLRLVFWKVSDFKQKLTSRLRTHRTGDGSVM